MTNTKQLCYIYPRAGDGYKSTPIASYNSDTDKIPECYVRSMALLDAACGGAEDAPYIYGIGSRTHVLNHVAFYYLFEI